MEGFPFKQQLALARMLTNIAENYLEGSNCVIAPYTIREPEHSNHDRVRISIDIYRPAPKQFTPNLLVKEDLLGDRIEENGQKYYVTYEPLKAYTTIGAENIHHAFNKATKEFKGKYTKIYRNFNARNSEWEFLSVKEFGELLRKV